jgi:energy-converting hydrogenase Eha subunit B
MARMVLAPDPKTEQGTIAKVLVCLFVCVCVCACVHVCLCVWLRVRVCADPGPRDGTGVQCEGACLLSFCLLSVCCLSAVCLLLVCCPSAVSLLSVWCLSAGFYLLLLPECTRYVNRCQCPHCETVVTPL